MSAAEQGRRGKRFDHKGVVNDERPNGQKKLDKEKWLRKSQKEGMRSTSSRLI